jgi:hypothetical protein
LSSVRNSSLRFYQLLNLLCVHDLSPMLHTFLRPFLSPAHPYQQQVKQRWLSLYQEYCLPFLEDVYWPTPSTAVRKTVMTTKQYEEHGQSKPIYVIQWSAYVVISLTVYKHIQDGQCTYNVTLKRFRKTIVAVEKQLVLHTLECVCSLRYSSNAHEPYCHLWPARLYSIFPDYYTNRMISERKLLNIKLCFNFLYNFRLKHLLFYKDMVIRKCTLVFV